jgi:hypothetical protein
MLKYYSEKKIFKRVVDATHAAQRDLDKQPIIGVAVMQSAATSWKHQDIFSLIPRSLLHLCADIWPSQALLL